MLRRIKEILGEGGRDAQGDDSLDPLQVAVGALLVEAAKMDDAYDAYERAAIAELLARRFELDAAAAERLLAAAEAKIADSAELYKLTRTIKDALSHEDRVDLMQMLWEVAYADGTLHHYEANLMRRIAGLVYVTDRESGEARKRALARLGIEG